MNMLSKHLTLQYETATYWARYELERFQAQIAFSDRLCALHPDKAKTWRECMRNAISIVEDVAGTGNPGALRESVRKAETCLAPISDVAKTYTVHCVGHAHIDMNWQWSWPETVSITLDSFATVLRLMDEFPSFTFSQSQASTYKIVEDHDPGMLNAIADRVKEGRWEVAASHWVEGDKNLASGESLIRHLLYTRQYMQDLFGLAPEDVPVDWSPDTFGHCATVPTYLAQGGIRYVYLHRPGRQGDPRPDVFWWKGPDGARVLVRNDMKLTYNNQLTPKIGTYAADYFTRTGLTDMMFVYGVGDHGGGPTRRDILRGLDMAEWPAFPSIRFGTARDYFTCVESSKVKLPLLDSELNFEFTGCYTSQALIKKANRHGENRLVDAETAATFAWLGGGRPYDSKAFRTAWRDTLYNHFHDILPGSGVHDTRTHTHGLFQQTLATTGTIETQSLRLLAGMIDTSSYAGEESAEVPIAHQVDWVGSGVGFMSDAGQIAQTAGAYSVNANRPFVIFNPLQWDREEVIEVTIWDNARWGGEARPIKDRVFAVQWSDGSRCAAQEIDTGAYWGHDFKRLAFPVKVAGFGYTTCAIVEAEAEPIGPRVNQVGSPHHCPYANVECDTEGLENDLLRVELDPVTGGLRRLLDKRSDVELIPAGAVAGLEYAVEHRHNMSAWQLGHTGVTTSPTVLDVKRVRRGPYTASLEVRLTVEQSQFTLTYELRADDPQLFLKLQGTWFERGNEERGVPTLRYSLPLALEDAQASYEIPFGKIERDIPGDADVPALNWAKVTGRVGETEAGCVLANDCKYGHCYDNGRLRLNLIRSSYNPDPLPEIGEHTVHLSLLPFSGHLSTAETTAAGRVLNHPLRAVHTDVHEGTLPDAAQALAVETKDVVVSSLKKAEASDAFLVRLYNTSGRKKTARVVMDKTLAGTIKSVRGVDALERPLKPNPAKALKSNRFSVELPAFGIASVCVSLKQKRIRALETGFMASFP